VEAATLGGQDSTLEGERMEGGDLYERMAMSDANAYGSGMSDMDACGGLVGGVDGRAVASQMAWMAGCVTSQGRG
jgi:hypothetical protein